MTQTASIFDREPTGHGVIELVALKPRAKKPKKPTFLDYLFGLFGPAVRICDEPDPSFHGVVIPWDTYLEHFRKFDRTTA